MGCRVSLSVGEIILGHGHVTEVMFKVIEDKNIITIIFGCHKIVKKKLTDTNKICVLYIVVFWHIFSNYE